LSSRHAKLGVTPRVTLKFFEKNKNRIQGYANQPDFVRALLDWGACKLSRCSCDVVFELHHGQVTPQITGGAMLCRNVDGETEPPGSAIHTRSNLAAMQVSQYRTAEAMAARSVVVVLACRCTQKRCPCAAKTEVRRPCSRGGNQRTSPAWWAVLRHIVPVTCGCKARKKRWAERRPPTQWKPTAKTLSFLHYRMFRFTTPQIYNARKISNIGRNSHVGLADVPHSRNG
jgi:hypothetical protein